MQELVTAFLAQLDAAGTTPPNTRNAYRTDLTQFLGFLNEQGTTSLAQLTQADLEAFCAWLAERGYAQATIARRVAALRAFGAFLVASQILATNPAEGFRCPSPRRAAPEVLTPEQFEQLRAVTLQAATPEAWRDRALLELIAATGLRASALVGLDLGDVDVDGGTLTLRGQGALREIALSPEAVLALVAYLRLGRARLAAGRARDAALWLNMRGERLTRQGLWVILQSYAAALDLPTLSPELLRQSAAAQRLAQGASLAEVQVFLGHAKLATTEIYQHAVPLAAS